MKNILTASFTTAFLAATSIGTMSAHADARTENGQTAAPLAGILQAGTLIRTERTINYCGEYGCLERYSDLQVSYIVQNRGSSTDLSPDKTVWLTMFNDINEEVNVSAQWRITEAYEVYEVRRVKAGIYHFDILELAATGDAPCRRIKLTIQADAQAASAAVRQGKGTGEFDTLTYTGPIAVGEVGRSCLDE